MSLELIVVTPQGEALSRPVEQVVLPGSEGEFGVLEKHENFLTSLRPGPVEIRSSDGGSEWVAVSDGFAEVTAERVVVLVDECLGIAEVDPEELRAERAEVEERIAGLGDDAEDGESRAALENRMARVSGYLEAHERSR